MSRSEMREENKEIKKQRRKARRRKIINFIKMTFLIIVLTGVGVAGYLGYKYYPDYKSMSAEVDEIIEQVNERTFIRLDPTQIVRKDGSVVREFTKAPYKYIEHHEMPSNVKDAFVAIEDKRFYNHEGVDLKANLRAVKALVDNKGEITQGASTITQQLVKNTFLTHEQTYERKIKEILISIRLENKLSKDKILEYYINNIYYGNGAHGIETAADYYFSDTVGNLSLSQIALLAAIPNNPTVFDPINNMENAIKRRNRILDHMFEEQYITEKELNDSKAEEIILNIKEKDKYVPEDYEVSYVMSSATKLVMEREGFEMKFKFDSDEQRKAYNKEFQEKFDEVHERIRAGGFIIESTIDPVKQQQLQESINSGMSQYTQLEESGLYKTQAAGVTIDNRTHELVAIVGGRTQDDIANTFNRAFLAYRQPGSSIKPINVYGVEIDNGMLGSTRVSDVKAKDGPANLNHQYSGTISAKDALVRSVNTVPFELMRRRGANVSHEYMSRMEFTNLVDADKNAATAVGGFTYGTTPLEITGAFATLVNNGHYVRPTGINSIKFDGEVIYENPKKEVKIYKDGTTYLLTDALKDVVKKYNLDIEGGIISAGKSGTTDDNKDGWFAGYSPYFTTSIWVGNDNPSTIQGLYGGLLPGKIWKNYMDKIHSGLEPIEFEIPVGTKKMYVNPTTGEVSDLKGPGFIYYEYVPGHYIATQIAEKERLAEIERQKEAERIRNEQIRKEEFLKKYGVTEEVEQANQASIENKIFQATTMQLVDENAYERAKSILAEAENMLNDIKVPQKRKDYEWQIERGYITIEQNRTNEINRQKAAEEERIRLEEERIKEEEEERIRLEEEAKQAELDRIEQERLDKLEKERLEQERIEKERLEKERLEKERLEQEIKDKEEEEKENPVVPEPTEPTPQPETPSDVE